MKKITTIILAVLMAFSACLITACKKNDPYFTTDADGNLVITRPVTLRFAAIESAKGEIDAFAAGFKKIYPQVTIRFEPISGDWTSKLLGQFRSGSAPDVFWVNEIYNYASADLLEELTPYFEALGVPKSDYFESMFTVGLYNGKLYMMPREYNKVVTFYNKKLFREVFGNTPDNELPFTPKPGTKYPADGWTWSEFTETAKCFIAKAPNGNIVRRGADISFSWPSAGPIIFEGLGGTIRSASGTTEGINFNTPGNLSIMQQLYDLTEEGAFLNQVLNDVGGILSGNLAMQFNSRPDTSKMEETFGEDWDAVSFPLLPVKPQIGSGSSGYAVNKSGRFKELAVRLLFYMTSVEGQEVFMKTGNCVPVRTSLIDSPTWRENPRTSLNHDAFLWREDLDVPAYNYRFDSPVARGKFDNAWANVSIAVFGKDKTLAQAMSYGQEELEKIFTAD